MSVQTDTSALHEYLCTRTENGHKYCKLFIKRPQPVRFSNYANKNKYLKFKRLRKNQERSVSVYTDPDQTYISFLVFLMNH